MKRTEICNNCGDDYIPSRRGAQKFCSNSCRSRYWFLKNKTKAPATEIAKASSEVTEIKDKKSDKMSLAGVGNATAGALVADGLRSFLTKQENKPATKKDITELKALITQRYLPINNIENDAIGRNPFYDMETQNVVYI